MPVMSRSPALTDAAQEARGIAHEVLNWLGEIAESIRKQWTDSNTLYIAKVMSSLTDTVVQDTVGPPPGVVWHVKRIAITSGANSGFAVYRNEVQPQNLCEGEFGNAAIAAFDTDIVVLEGQQLVLRFYGQPIGQQCTVNLRVDETSVNE